MIQAMVRHASALCAPSEAVRLVQSLPGLQGRLIATSSSLQRPDDEPAAADAQAAASSSSPSQEQEAAEASTSEAASTASSKSHGARAPHVSLDNPVLNIYLRYNTQFMTDPDRAYAIGHRNAFENTVTLELRKALAAHRLQLRDAAAAGHGSSKQRLAKQMNNRLAEMRAYMADSAFR